MTSRERIRTIISGKPADRCGFWLGNPHGDSWPGLHAFFGTSTEEELRRKLGDDFRWVMAGHYRHPASRAPFYIPNKTSHSCKGPFADCETVAELENYEWPEQKYIDFEPALNALKAAGHHYRASGMWTCFYHDIMDLFGMESYMINMQLNPELVEAVTDRVCNYYYEANERYFDLAGDEMDAFFLGNDFGTQLDLICGPAQFDRFIMPWFRKFTDQAHRRGYQVILHSCGSIYRVIDRLIDAGVECLHPLQARARNMEAETLAKAFKGKIAFLGGIDTQELLVHGTPDEIKADVRRVKKLLGPCLIVSPSHEALLPDVPPSNVLAMAEEAIRFE